MLILPAIDLYKGEAVRLYQGDYTRKTVYSANPLATAMDFVSAGAVAVHLVDLEGAESGSTPNRNLILKIKEKTGLFTEVGGGIRSMETIEFYLSQGIDRVILGTAALQNEALLGEAVAKYRERIAVSVDIKDGYVAVRGWKEKSEVNIHDFCQQLTDAGVRTIICTDISRDGAMRGANLEMYRELSVKYPLEIIASGGVSSLDDIRNLKEMGLYGAIIGKAYYTGAVSLKEAIKEAA